MTDFENIGESPIITLNKTFEDKNHDLDRMDTKISMDQDPRITHNKFQIKNSFNHEKKPNSRNFKSQLSSRDVTRQNKTGGTLNEPKAVLTENFTQHHDHFYNSFSKTSPTYKVTQRCMTSPGRINKLTFTEKGSEFVDDQRNQYQQEWEDQYLGKNSNNDTLENGLIGSNRFIQKTGSLIPYTIGIESLGLGIHQFNDNKLTCQNIISGEINSKNAFIRKSYRNLLSNNTRVVDDFTDENGNLKQFINHTGLTAK